MSKKASVEERLAWLEKKLEDVLPSRRQMTVGVEDGIPPEERPDYIAHGSPEHAGFLGIVETTEKEAEQEGFEVTYKSPKTGKTYRLMDELGAAIHYPDYDPQVAAKTVLRQKVSSLESGPPPVAQSDDPAAPNYAPPLWEPAPADVARTYLGMLGR